MLNTFDKLKRFISHLFPHILKKINTYSRRLYKLRFLRESLADFHTCYVFLYKYKSVLCTKPAEMKLNALKALVCTASKVSLLKYSLLCMYTNAHVQPLGLKGRPAVSFLDKNLRTP